MNPGGLLTWAFLVKFKNQIIHKDTQILGWGEGRTNNIGEMSAVLAAIHWLITLPKNEHYPVIINSDSELIVKQCSGTCNCNNETLSYLLGLIKKGRATYGKAITFRWIPREKNKEADELSRSLYKGNEKAIEMLKKHKLDIQFGWDDLSF
jgi:ribonuclease HI